MKLNKLLIVSTLSAVALTACAKETFTVDFLRENHEKRKEILADCKFNKQSDENCRNANQAQREIFLKEEQLKRQERLKKQRELTKSLM